MTQLYILNPHKFQGNCLTTMDSDTGKIDYTNLKWEEYNKSHENQLIAIEWDEFYEKWIVPYQLSLQKDWEETTEENFNEMLEILPPLRYEIIGNYLTFFVGEAYTGSIYQMFAQNRTSGKCWKALRDVTKSKEELEKELSKLE